MTLELASDKIQNHVQKMGSFQIRALAVLMAMSFLNTPVVVLCSVFVLYTPSHRCYVPSIDDQNLSTSALGGKQSSSSINSNDFASVSNSSILYQHIPTEPGPDGNLRWSQCHIYVKGDNSSVSNRSQTTCVEGWVFDIDNHVFSAAMEFSLVCDQAYMAPLAPSLSMFGYMVGAMAGGYVSDRFGRQFTQLSTCLAVTLLTIILAFLPVWYAAYFLWFAMGCVVTSREISMMSLVNETTPSRYRHLVGTMIMLSAALGYMAVPGFSYIFPNWRHVLAVYGGLEVIVLLMTFFFVHESLSWLMQKNKAKKAKKLLLVMSKVNNFAIENTEILLKKNDTEEQDTSENKKTEENLSYSDLLTISFLRKRWAIFAIGWFAVTLAYYGLSLNTNNIGGNRYLANFIGAATELPGTLVCFLTMKKLGGRRSFMFTTGFSSVCLLITPLLEFGGKWFTITSTMLGKLLISGSLANLYIFTGELFPTLLRTQALGGCTFLARIAGILAPFMVFIGEELNPHIPYIVPGLVGLVATAAMFFLPETKFQPLPDTIEDAQNQERNSIRLSCAKKTVNNRSNENEDVLKPVLEIPNVETQSKKETCFE
ncbi:unnamed protein product [Clavelina lepadiformis]|uniref:Major facilitator superfamily (MFS) profile domain-containing protein n=1 Tax=Clavelina lepadiformis TaxID=159417 RepID=A0ABP0FIS7_CLALP